MSRDDRSRFPQTHAQASVLREIACMWRAADALGFASQLRALNRPRPLRTLAAAGIDWALICAATVSVAMLGWVAMPLGLLVIGNRQRALGNLLHDASHRSFDRNRVRAGVAANLLFCWPLWVSMRIYRAEHNRHHRYLGDPVRDPDYIHDANRLRHGWLRVWLAEVFCVKMFRIALLSHLGRMDARSAAGVATWWATVLMAIALGAGGRHALLFAGLWVGARALVFHPITALREISDHVGLVPGTLMGFSRNHPFGGLAGQVFHPHHNGYHLLHHLCPGIPFHAIPRAHALLAGWPAYAAGEHCTGYFRGEASAVRSWVRRYQSSARTG